MPPISLQAYLETLRRTWNGSATQPFFLFLQQDVHEKLDLIGKCLNCDDKQKFASLIQSRKQQAIEMDLLLEQKGKALGCAIESCLVSIASYLEALQTQVYSPNRISALRGKLDAYVMLLNHRADYLHQSALLLLRSLKNSVYGEQEAMQTLQRLWYAACLLTWL